MKKQVQIKIEDTGGKTWTLTRTDEGVKIEAPVALRTRPIPLEELKRAVTELDVEPV